jgi:hypothetical protein
MTMMTRAELGQRSLTVGSHERVQVRAKIWEGDLGYDRFNDTRPEYLYAIPGSVERGGQRSGGLGVAAGCRWRPAQPCNPGKD